MRCFAEGQGLTVLAAAWGERPLDGIYDAVQAAQSEEMHVVLGREHRAGRPGAQ